MDQDDAHLVKLTREGAEGAFDKLVEKYFRRVGALVYQKIRSPQDVEDLVQETFTRAFAQLDTLRNPEKFGSWVYSIAGRLVIDTIRKNKHRQHPSLDEMKKNNFEPPAKIKTRMEPDAFNKIMAAMGELPDNYRLVVTLRFMEGMGAKDIAEHLGEPQGTIRNRLFRANRMLRKKLKGLL